MKMIEVKKDVKVYLNRGKFMEPLEVYSFQIIEDISDSKILNNVYGMLNVNHPQGYNQRSLSVGDMITIDQKAFTVAGMGFRQLGLSGDEAVVL